MIPMARSAGGKAPGPLAPSAAMAMTAERPAAGKVSTPPFRLLEYCFGRLFGGLM